MCPNQRNRGLNRWDALSPVRVNVDESVEWLFLRPGVTRANLRWAAMRAGLRDELVVLLAGVAGTAVGVGGGASFLGWFLVVIGPLASVVALVEAGRFLRSDDAWVCALSYHPARFVYRTQEFATLPKAERAVADGIVRTVDAVFSGPASVWIGPEPLRDLHDVAWSTLRQLGEIQRLRGLVQAGLESHALLQMVAKMSREAAETLAELRNCVLLVEAWNSQLQQARRPDAREITEAAFARVTAARDIYGGGPFAWERN